MAKAQKMKKRKLTAKKGEEMREKSVWSEALERVRCRGRPKSVLKELECQTETKGQGRTVTMGRPPPTSTPTPTPTRR